MMYLAVDSPVFKAFPNISTSIKLLNQVFFPLFAPGLSSSYCICLVTSLLPECMTSQLFLTKPLAILYVHQTHYYQPSATEEPNAAGFPLQTLKALMHSCMDIVPSFFTCF